MFAVKRTFSIPAELDVVIPNRERAKFIASSLRDALRERKRKELLDLLDRIANKENLDSNQSEFEFGPLGEICALNERLQRNSLPRSGYKPAMAERMTSERKLQEPKIEHSSPLKTHILDSLAMEQSPEQIAGRFKLTGSKRTISVETLYAWIYEPYERRQKFHRLLSQAKSRRGHRARKGRRLPAIPDRLPIHMRPTKGSLESRTRPLGSRFDAPPGAENLFADLCGTPIPLAAHHHYDR